MNEEQSNVNFKKPKEDWVITFLNLPPAEQIEFLYRFSLDEELRRDIEKRVFGE